MNQSDKRKIWRSIFAALGIVTTGLWFGLHRFLWRLWLAVSFLWVLFWLVVGFSVNSGKATQQVSYWLIVIGPPLILLLIAGLISWALAGLRGDVSSNPPGPDSSVQEKRRALGYDQ